MSRMLSVSIEKCTGCGTCELMCSFSHHGEFNPSKARIHKTVFLHDMIAVPVVCLQCEDAWCAKACPSGALVKGIEPNSGATRLSVDEAKCVGCRVCALACPLGAIEVRSSGHAEKCDLCDGDPQCVKFCARGALKFEDADGSARERRQKLAQQLMTAYQEAV